MVVPVAKVAFFELEGWEEPRIRSELSGHSLYLSRKPLTLEEAKLARDAEIVSVFIYSRIDRKVLDELPSLRAIVTRSAGIDHIDLNACAERGIEVYNVPDYSPESAAEYAILLAMALARNLHVMLRSDDLRLDAEQVRGWRLAGRTMGVIGTGRIGSHAAKLARALGMRVLAYDLYVNEELAKLHQVEYVDLDTLLSSSDVITIHVPLTQETRHLINRRNVRRIKRGAILINTARGGLVETEALLEALDEGLRAGAALDVFEGEWVLRSDWSELVKSERVNEEELRKAILALRLSRHPRVILTPHVAYNTWEAVEQILTRTINTVSEILSGRRPKNIVTPIVPPVPAKVL